jgi:glucose-6-phosphate 1-dehydrogenase
VTEIAVEFKQPPLYLFNQLVQEGDLTPPKPMANVLVLRIQPDEGISLSFACKRPGIGIQLTEVNMDFFYELAFQQRTPDAYERLLLDALRGDPSLFTRSDEVDYAWRFSTSVLEGWANLPPQKFPNYYAYTDGPVEASRLMEGTRAEWRPLSQM